MRAFGCLRLLFENLKICLHFDQLWLETIRYVNTYFIKRGAFMCKHYKMFYINLLHGWSNIQGNITRAILILILPRNGDHQYFQQYFSCYKTNKVLRVHNNMVIDPRDRKKWCPRLSGLGITITFPRVDNHVDMDPSGIIHIIF